MIGACCIVEKNGKYLVQHRIRKTGFVYEFPCGKVDNGETYEIAAVRELMEETGLKAKVKGKVIEIQDGIDFTMGFVLLKISKEAEPKITNPRRKQTFYWMKPSEIPKDKFTKVCKEYVEKFLLPNTTEEIYNKYEKHSKY